MMSTTGKRKNKALVFLKGFTLVELLIAVAVIAVGMVFVLGALNQCVAALNAADKTIRAADILSRYPWWTKPEALCSLLNIDNVSEMAEGEWSGVFGQPYEGFNWTVTIQSVSEDFGDETKFVQDKLYEVSYTIGWKQGRSARNVSAITYLPKPPERMES